MKPLHQKQLTISQAVSHTGKCRLTIRKYIQRKELQATLTINNGVAVWHIDADSLESWLAEYNERLAKQNKTQ